MNTLLKTGTIGLASLVTAGMIAWPATTANAQDDDPAATKRDDDSQVVVTTVDDDDDDDTGLKGTGTQTRTRTGGGTNTGTNTRTGTNSGHDNSRSDTTRDHTQRRTGSQQHRPLPSRHQRRHPPQHPRVTSMTRPESWGFVEGDSITAELTVVRRLGGGSGYEAYLAFDEHTFGPVVVKVVRPDRIDDEHSLRGLAREVEALATVNHPVVVRGLRHELGGERPHVVLEQVDGPRLSTLIRRYGPLPEQQYLPLAIEVASALHYLRRIGWTHLDVKPSNVIMGAPARLIDLSVARPVARRRAQRADRHRRLHGAGAVGPGAVRRTRAGQRRVGTRRHPLRGGRRRAGVDTTTSTSSAALPDGVPTEVAKIVYAALELDPADRPLPHEVAEALEPVLDRQPVGPARRRAPDPLGPTSG